MKQLILKLILLAVISSALPARLYPAAENPEMGLLPGQMASLIAENSGVPMPVRFESLNEETNEARVTLNGQIITVPADELHQQKFTDAQHWQTDTKSWTDYGVKAASWLPGSSYFTKPLVEPNTFVTGLSGNQPTAPSLVIDIRHGQAYVAEPAETGFQIKTYPVDALAVTAEPAEGRRTFETGRRYAGLLGAHDVTEGSRIAFTYDGLPEFGRLIKIDDHTNAWIAVEPTNKPGTFEIINVKQNQIMWPTSTSGAVTGRLRGLVSGILGEKPTVALITNENQLIRLGENIIRAIIRGDAIQPDWLNENAVKAVTWYLYYIAATKNQCFKEGTFLIEDPHEAILNYLSQLPDSYVRKSSHFVRYARENKVQHYGFDFSTPVFENKNTILFGRAADGYTFIKPENHGFYSLLSLDAMAHAREFVVAQYTKALGAGGDDLKEYRKERTPVAARKAWKIFMDTHPFLFGDVNQKSAEYIYEMVNAANSLITRFPSVPQAEFQEIINIITTDPYTQTQYDHLKIRHGREVIITQKDFDDTDAQRTNPSPAQIINADLERIHQHTEALPAALARPKALPAAEAQSDEEPHPVIRQSALPGPADLPEEGMPSAEATAPATEGIAFDVQPQESKTIFVDEVNKQGKIVKAAKEIHTSAWHYGHQYERSNMEDSHVEALSPQFDFFAVYDGHDGRIAADYAAENLHLILAQLLNAGVNPRDALVQACQETDKRFCNTGSQGGTTAIIALVDKTQRTLYLANIADARAVVYTDAGAVIAYTVDHNLKGDTLMGKSERKRITDAGGKIENKRGMDRVSGKINITRAIGDCSADLKPYLIPTPDVIQLDIPIPGFMVLACDGLWDAGKDSENQVTNEIVGQIAAPLIAAGATNAEVAQALVAEAQSRGIKDNISVTVVNFNQPEAQPTEAQQIEVSTRQSGRPGPADLPEEGMPSAEATVKPSSIPVPPPLPPKSSASDQTRKQSTLPSDLLGQIKEGKELKQATPAMQDKPKSLPAEEPSAMDIEKLMAQRRALLREDSGVPIDEASETSAGAASSTGSQISISSETPVETAPIRRPMPSGDLLNQIQEGKSLKRVEAQAKPVAPSLATSLQTGQAASMLQRVQEEQEQQQESPEEGSSANWGE